ncbi:DUF4428 domain-containing protein [Lactiplantibacillus fabifermentans]|uniref:SHOCT domain-containing protein n=2 Tax=Lactiplantibacillus fabifermentans TaxID=483011 RepID=A0A0R2NU31_9LACO|nr:DUF4428 domain-containing protein [Lactiplantibacillus fabifermentans]ETY74626.1 hypothetical protein LFAB_06225 [Lactiplantibacillus fabifermentans T30PCM01]KRO29222.1 hypothetical protein DY78_GL001273 [Lactiplantibacillus fabifermentans DSM 21115]
MLAFLIVIIILSFKFLDKAAPYVIIAAILLYIYHLIKGAFLFIWRGVTSTPGLIIIGTIAVIVLLTLVLTANMCDVCSKKYRHGTLAHVKDGKVCFNCLQQVGVDLTQLPTDISVEKTLSVKDIKDLQAHHTVIDPLNRWQYYQTHATDEAPTTTKSAMDASLSTQDTADLHELKALLDDGIITQAEFDAKKKQILGL